MVCTNCKQAQDHLVKTFVGSFKRHNDNDRGKLVTCHFLCRQCVVGKVLPVWRPVAERWQIGELVSFDVHSGKHRVLFLDDSEEDVIVEQSPYDDYLAHYRGRARQNSAPEAEDEIEPIPFEPLQRQDGKPPSNFHAKENERIMKKALKRQAANQETDATENLDWSLRRVAETSGESPVRKVTPTLPHPGAPCALQRNDQHRRPGPRMWTYEEDKELIKCVEAATEPIKWTVVAESIEGRTGKQVRERYLNHLKPKLKKEEWTALEDTLLFQMYLLLGTKWALMRKALPGRTDNRIKNRFHFLRRRVERDAGKLLGKAGSVLKDNKSQSPDKKAGGEDLQTKIRDIIPHLAAATLKKDESPYSFGPFRPANNDVCQRCNFMAPSSQTGRVICETTGWCEACTRLPPYVCGTAVQRCLNLRKTINATSVVSPESKK